MKKITFLALGMFALFGWQASAQFSESFDAGIPASWTVLNQDGGDYTWAGVTTIPHTGAGHVVVHWEAAAHNDLLISPTIAVAAGVNDQFSFWAGINGTSWTENFEVRVSTTGTAAADFTVLGAGTVTTDAFAGNYTKFVYNLTPYVGQNIHVAIVAVDTDRFYLYVDDVVSDALPSCVAPIDGVADVTSTTSADLSWTTGGAANSEVVVQAAGTGVPADANDTGVNVTGTTYTATVSAATMYEFYVRDECTLGSEFSEWSGPFAFNTFVVPGCSAPITPADGATEVPTGDITFEWAAPTTGDPATSYDMYYGETADDVTNFVGNFEDTTALITITGFDVTFYWRIVPINEAGEATGCEGDAWSFTTQSPPLPPVNDECAGAIAITAAGDFATGAIVTTNSGATEDTLVPSCQANVDSTVWYTVVVPASGTLTLETQAADGSSLSDTIIVAYTGTCGALVAAGCNDDKDADNSDFFSTLPLTGLVGGSTLYVAVSRYGSSGGAAGEFQLAAYDASLLATDTFDTAAFVSYPNPVSDVLNLSYNKNITDVNVFNLLGQQVLSKSVNANQSKIDMSTLSAGTYMVKVTSDNQVKTIKVMKQ